MWLALLLAAELLDGNGFSRGLAPVDAGAPAAQLSARACAACHADAHAEWRASRHGLAWTNAIFQREYRQQPLEWCVHCHAPLAEQLTELRALGSAEEHPAVRAPIELAVPSGRAPEAASAPASSSLAAEGVTCAVCHLRAGRIVAADHRPSSPHDTDVRVGFGGPAFCAGCHQFNFPRIEGAGPTAHVVGYAAHPMQDTVDQHARGPLAQTTCRACHAISPGRHAYPGGHDPAMLARAVELSTCRSGAALRLTLTNVGAGHNVPTGDLHRHLVLRAWRPGAPERLFEATFGRTFEADPAGGKRPTSDATLPPRATRVTDVPAAALGPAVAAEPIRVELRLVYTIDEFPFRGRELDEPTFATVARQDVDWTHLARCPPGPRRPPEGARTPARTPTPRENTSSLALP